MSNKKTARGIFQPTLLAKAHSAMPCLQEKALYCMKLTSPDVIFEWAYKQQIHVRANYAHVTFILPNHVRTRLFIRDDFISTFFKVLFVQKRRT